LDYGCGTGSAVPLLLENLGVTWVIGTDISVKLLEEARRMYDSAHTQFLLFDHYQPDSKLDLIFCNGVFHHIPPHERTRAVDYIYRALRPGGVFSFWENNPWNPGTRYVMSRIPFDRDAITLTPPEARRLLRTHGFEILRTDFLFIFPRSLRWLRCIEPLLSRLPVGAQYQILCRRL
jgi:trans-aconitate methyltransferase